MITKPNFSRSLMHGIQFLRDIDLFKSKSVKFGHEVSKEFKEISTCRNIVKIYDIATANNDYDIILNDDSIFQFQHGSDFLRYAFIQNPREYLTIEEFAETIFDVDELKNLLDSMDVLELYNIINPEYEKYKETEDRLGKFNYIRYDFSEKGYIPNLHSCSHLHIGMVDDVRIPLATYLSPANFIKFCIKNTFYNAYKKYFKNDEGKLKKFVSDIKQDCLKLSNNYWVKSEEDELFLK